MVEPAWQEIVALQGKLAFTPETVTLQAQLAKDNLPKIHLVRLWLPLIALIVGILSLVAGVFLLRRRDRQPPAGGDTVAAARAGRGPIRVWAATAGAGPMQMHRYRRSRHPGYATDYEVHGRFSPPAASQT